MGLSIHKLLQEYFSKEEVQDALRDIGELTSGTKDELVDHLANNWKSYNRDIYDLLDFTDKNYLQMICYHYNLDATPASKDVLIKRIKKVDLLEKISKKNSIIKNDLQKETNLRRDKPIIETKERFRDKAPSMNEHKISKKMLTWTIVGAVATIIGVITSIIFYLK